MNEVKTKPVRRNVGTLLFNVIAEHDFKRFLKQMCAGMVLLCIQTSVLINKKMCCIADLDNTAYNNTDVCYFSAADRLCIFYPELAFRSAYKSLVTDLTAHGSIERGFFRDDSTLVAFCQSHYGLTGIIVRDFRRQDNDFRIILDSVISGKFGRDGRIEFVINCEIFSDISRSLSCFSGALTLLLHSCLETVLVRTKTLIPQNVLCEI